MSHHRLNQPIRARPSDDELSEDLEDGSEQVGSIGDASSSEDDESQSDIGSDQESLSEPEDGQDDDDDDQQELKDISFGALAKAQESFNPAPRSSKKRKASELLDADGDHDETHKTRNTISTITTKEHKHPDSKPNQPIHRTSKHAPMIMSSRHPVSRKRQVFEPPATEKSRDPRFDATIKSSTLNARATEHADRNYSFLTTYQATEVLALKSQLKKAKDEDSIANIKRQIMSLESKIRNAESKSKQRDILRKHKDSEKQAIREGKKARPFYLKSSDVRKQVEKDRVDAMGKKARDKMEKRKIKKQKGKEGRDLPRYRRAVDS